ncbi:kinase-like domain-containing protein [Lentinula raphanica]|uniref:Kinase-like domain-containing protein n=1 Tax=Lentinula raphanica TaxID=153919 RepID=A0AA38PMN0_9AGAR|nr:kinase-like domain-containing protein [Lentinula raphanica]KAJ3973474.1 kinase-like domain-containing protein [Lentinula raphanica]
MDDNEITFEQYSALRQSTILNSRNFDFSALSEHEIWWIQHFEYLKEHGYLMRPRYRPGWKPSYDPRKFRGHLAEDGQMIFRYTIMDALRISDSLVVAMKRVKDATSEAQIATSFSDDAHNSDPRNHCVRIIDVLPVPGAAEKILVMAWMRKVMDPRFRTVGEGIQFLSEMIEGLQYMHQNNIAHRDCAINNMAMEADAMYTRPYHPMRPKKRYDWSGRALHHSRTRCPPRYYLIDFGCSRMYDPSQPRPAEYAIRSGGYTPPEGLQGIPCDPFATDVYILGNLIRISFLDGDYNPNLDDPGMSGFEFLRSLVEDMVGDDPSKRPTMDEVASRFSQIVEQVPWWKLRARTTKKDENSLIKPFRALYHGFWTASMMLLSKPAIPSPKPVH